jgi:hypothetical protein
MATMFSSALKPNTSNTGYFQTWAAWVESVLTTIAGWTVTTDTGQTLPFSLTAPTAQFQKMGYRIYQMNDDFTVDNPIYMRIDYGSGFTANTLPGIGPGMWISFGTGTDGAGNLIGVLWSGQGWGAAGTPTVYSNNAYQLNIYDTRNYASADNSRFVIGMFVYDFANPAGIFGSDQICFSFERTRDTNGDYTGDGILITYSDPQLIGGGGVTQSLNTHKYLICNRGGRSQPSLEKGLAYSYIRHSPAYSYDGGVPCALCSHFRGIAQQPGINFILMGMNDIALEGQFQINIYGSNRVYQNLRYLVAARSTAGPLGTVLPLNDYGCRVSILYE